MSLLDLPAAPLHPGLLALMVLVATLGTVGNLLIIGTVCLSRRLRTTGNAFVVNLAVADLVVTAYIMPIGIATAQIGDGYPLGGVFCQFNGFALFLTLGVSTQTLMVIAIERYIHICHTARYRKAFTGRLVALYVFLIWAHSAAWSCQGFTGLLEYRHFPSIYLCAMRLTHATFNICLVLFGMILPIVAMAFAYGSILHTVCRSHANVYRKDRLQDGSLENLTHTQRKRKGEHRFLLTLFIIMVVYLVCWTPTALVMAVFGRSETLPSITFVFCMWLALSNSSMNAIIYGAMNRNFRKGYRNFARSLICCTKPSADGSCCKCPSGQEESASTSQSKLPAEHQMSPRLSNDRSDRSSSGTASTRVSTKSNGTSKKTDLRSSPAEDSGVNMGDNLTDIANGKEETEEFEHAMDDPCTGIDNPSLSGIETKGQQCSDISLPQKNGPVCTTRVVMPETML